VVAVLERYAPETPGADMTYDLVYGEPFPEAANLPDYVADREEEAPNPANERFFTADGKEVTPELDDDAYTPETSLRPKMPEKRTYSPHNISGGIALFRNRALPTTGDSTTAEPGQTRNTTYQGYSVRYAYTFRTHYWLRSEIPALLSAEVMTGIYNFTHTFPNQQHAQIRVIPVGFNVRYMLEVSRMFRLYPYVGYQNHIVSAMNGDVEALEPLAGGRLLGGAGGQMVLSESLDARLEGGSDGVFFGLVAKF
jgi:hypothetical protein